MILGPVLTHRAGGDDKAGNAYYVGSVLGLPNATEQDYPQVWAYAEMRRSARVASVRYLPIVWKSRLVEIMRYMSDLLYSFDGVAQVVRRNVESVRRRH